MKKRPILLLEINEVPWRLLDRFKDHRDLPNIRRFFEASRTFTTVTADEGHLSPWITWPTFHRGMPNTAHGVGFLGQDPATFKGTPIWDEYRKLGESIGVFGSLQSWPPKDPGKGGFYVPDTFAHDARCIPSYVEPFQAYNLMLTSKNGRVVNRGSFLAPELVPFLASLPRLGISSKTYVQLARQLIAERFDANRCARRPVFQGLLAWDLFKKLYDPANPPAFSTFFTNHVAGVIHRYWDHVFPEDFGHKREGKGNPHYQTILFALRVLDDILGDAMEFCEKNPELVVVFASSMGQDTIHRDTGGVESAIADVDKLMQACGVVTAQYRKLLAMVPQVAVEILDPADRARVKELLESARSASGHELFEVKSVEKSLSITLINPKRQDVVAGSFTMNGHKVSWADAGVRAYEVEEGTAYHIPEGVMGVFGRGVWPDQSRTRMCATDAKKFLLELGGQASDGRCEKRKFA